MRDIVENLRQWGDVSWIQPFSIGTPQHPPAELLADNCREAADTIEALRAEVQRLRKGGGWV